MLQFITNENSQHSPVEQILAVMKGGCRWVQIRMKSATDDEIKDVFFKIREEAKKTLTTVIINDRVELAKSLAAEGVAGVHLGLEDMPAAMARELLGPDAIIGVTAHSADEAKSYKGLDIDYIGVGPFAQTDTKKNLAPILGLEGLAEIVIIARESGMETPLAAVGGIQIDDVEEILAVGANGIAVSGAIANADNMEETTREFLKKLPLEE